MGRHRLEDRVWRANEHEQPCAAGDEGGGGGDDAGRAVYDCAEAGLEDSIPSDGTSWIYR